MEPQNQPQPSNEAPQDQQQSAVERPVQTENTAPQQPGPSESSSKKILFIVLIIAALVGIGGGAYLLGSTISDETTDTAASEQAEDQSAKQSESTSNLFEFATTEFAYNLNTDNELERIAEASGSEQIVAVAEDRSAVYKVLFVNNTTQPDKLIKVAGGEETAVSNFSNGETYSFGTVSPDGTKLAYFKTVEATFEYSIGELNLESGEMTDGYMMQLDASTRPTLLTGATWVNNDQVVSGEASCFQCDGPPLPRYFLVNPSNGEIELLADLTEEKTSNEVRSGLTLSSDKKTLFTIVHDNQTLGGSFESLAQSTSTFYSISIASGELTEIGEVKGASAAILGLSSDQSSLLITTTAAQEPVGDSDNFTASPVIQFMNASSGKLSPIPIEVTQLDDDFATINNLAFDSRDEILYFSIKSLPEKSKPNLARTVLYRLPIASGEENSVTTLFDMNTDNSERILQLNVRPN